MAKTNSTRSDVAKREHDTRCCSLQELKTPWKELIYSRHHAPFFKASKECGIASIQKSSLATSDPTKSISSAGDRVAYSRWSTQSTRLRLRFSRFWGERAFECERMWSSGDPLLSRSMIELFFFPLSAVFLLFFFCKRRQSWQTANVAQRQTKGLLRPDQRKLPVSLMLGLSDFQLLTFVSGAIFVGTYWLHGLLFLAVDLTKRPSFIYKTKIQKCLFHRSFSDKHFSHRTTNISSSEAKKLISLVGLNTFIVTPIFQFFFAQLCLKWAISKSDSLQLCGKRNMRKMVCFRGEKKISVWFWLFLLKNDWEIRLSDLIQM